jgi:hypothetical protein
LQGAGTPGTDGIFNFIIRYDGQECSVPVSFLPSGSGGPAVFALNITSGNCTGATPAGSYALGVALGSGNTVPVSVNVTTIGTYTITATGGGMTFSASGSFSATGPQTVTLNGTGTPTTAGNNIIPITVGTSSCNFTVNVGSAAVGTLGGATGACTPFTLNGTYTAGTVLSTGNTVQIQVNVTTPGAYNITTNTANGISFSVSGNFANTGVQNLTLNGTGTPAAAGPFNYTVTFGNSSCTFPVVTAAAGVIDYFPRTAGSNWSYEIDDDPLDSVLRYVITPTHSALGNTYNIFMINDGSGPDSSGYYRKSGTDYSEFIDMGSFIGFDSPMWVDYIFLKDAALNTNWKSASYVGLSGGQPLTVRLSYTVKQKDVPLTFTTSTGAMNFSNVIMIEEKYEALIGGVWQDLTTFVGYNKSYYARGVGWVKFEAFDETGALFGQLELRRYNVL